MDIWRAADLMLKRYGEKALEKSAARADELAAAGDDNGATHCRRRNDRSADSTPAFQYRPSRRPAGRRYRVATAGGATGCKQLLKNRLPQVKAALIFSLTPHAQFALFGSSVVAL